jgi:hypothetical protein
MALFVGVVVFHLKFFKETETQFCWKKQKENIFLIPFVWNSLSLVFKHTPILKLLSSASSNLN